MAVVDFDFLKGLKLQKIAGLLSCAMLTCVLLTSFAFSQDQVELTEQERAWLDSNPVLTVTNDTGWAPLDYVRAGRPAGFSVDYMKLLAEKVGVELEFVSGPTWSALVEGVRDKEIDIVHGIVSWSSREEFLLFTDPYFDLRIGIYGREGTAQVNDISAFDGKVIGVIAGSAVTAEIQAKYPDLNYASFDFSLDALTALSSGKVDYTIGMLPTANYSIRSNFIDKIEVVGRYDNLGLNYEAQIRLATHIDNEVLHQILRKGMLAISEAEVLALEEKWLSSKVGNTAVQLSTEEKAWIAENPVLRASNEMDWAPLDYVQDGKPAGFSVDYLNLLASKIGFEVEYVNGYSWPELLEMLENRELDIAHSITKTAERETFLNFTNPYLDMPKVYYGRNGAAPVRSLEDLTGRKIGMISSWGSSGEFMKAHPDLDYVQYDSAKEALIALSKGQIDVFSSRLPIANYIIANNLITGLEVLGKDISSENDGQNYLRVASRNDEPILNRILEKGMAAITDQEFGSISEKWRSRIYGADALELTSEELEWLSENSALKVIIDQNRTPYEFTDKDGRISGIAGAYLDIFARKLNVPIVWAGNEDAAQAVEMMRSGEPIILSGIVPTPERRESFHFTDSYMQSTAAIFSRQGGEFFVNMDGLNGRRIAQERSFALTDFIRRDHPEIEIVEVNTVIDALKMVASGEVDAHVGDIPTVAYHISDGNFPVMAAGDTPYVTDTAFAVSKNHPMLASVLQKAMASVTEEERAEISNKWLAIRFENGFNKELILKIVAGAVICASVMLLWLLSLQREIGRRKIVEKELVKAQMQAEAASHAKSTFLANMSHEIRTPLNAIIGFSELMGQKIFGEISPSKYGEYIKDIEMSGRHLTTVINDILDLSKIEAGKWDLMEEEFELDACIRGALMMLESPANRKQVRLFYSPTDSDDDITLFGDEVAMRRVLINLLSNAVKFTENGGMVSVLVSPEENGALNITVKDTGIGIAPDRIEHVMMPFGQNQDDQYMVATGNGTGLGLSIVKELAELHDGEFRLESEVNVGTEATIILPPQRVITKTTIVSDKIEQEDQENRHRA